MSDNGRQRAVILGCGSSGGVPRLGGPDGAGNWGTCDPGEPRNRRTRCSLLVERAHSDFADRAGVTSVVIDTSPDMRAQLLADVYINLTRGQDALLIDVSTNEPTLGTVVAVDLRSFVLPVLMATDHELAAHDDLLGQLDKSSKGQTLFRQIDVQGLNAVA